MKLRSFSYFQLDVSCNAPIVLMNPHPYPSYIYIYKNRQPNLSQVSTWAAHSWLGKNCSLVIYWRLSFFLFLFFFSFFKLNFAFIFISLFIYFCSLLIQFTFQYQTISPFSSLSCSLPPHPIPLPSSPLRRLPPHRSGGPVRGMGSSGRQAGNRFRDSPCFGCWGNLRAFFVFSSRGQETSIVVRE